MSTVQRKVGAQLKLFSWWHNWGGARFIATSLFKQGLVQANQHEHRNAIEYYTGTIDTVDAPQDIKAMALYNRALLYNSRKDFVRARNDLNAVLDMPAALRQIKGAARQKLDRMNHHQLTGNTGSRKITPSQVAGETKLEGIEI